jgi:hypothetical protein
LSLLAVRVKQPKISAIIEENITRTAFSFVYFLSPLKATTKPFQSKPAVAGAQNQAIVRFVLSSVSMEKYLSDLLRHKHIETKGENFTMRKDTSIAFCTLMLCILLLMVNIGTALASMAGYSVTEVYGGGAITLDGIWTSAEWPTDGAWIDTRFNVSNARLGYKMDSNTGAYLMSWAVDWHDTTNDAGDVWIVCIDGSADGGAAPQTDDVKIQITGHTTLAVFAGNGTGWSPMTTSAVTWKDKLGTSPYDSSTHWTLEVQADKGALGAWGANPPPEGFYVAMYDASTSQWASWPPAQSANVPNNWGLIATYDTTVPESLSLGVLVLLSSAAILLGSFFVRKRRLANSPATTIR